MSKKAINQKTNYNSELLNSIGSNFIFDENPINRLKNNTNDLKAKNNINEIDKEKELGKLIEAETNKQLNKFSRIYFDKSKINYSISEK